MTEALYNQKECASAKELPCEELDDPRQAGVSPGKNKHRQRITGRWLLPMETIFFLPCLKFSQTGHWQTKKSIITLHFPS